MSKYITDFNQTGNSTLNVDLVCKDWNERFSISTWINENEDNYTFVVNGKRKNTRICKTQISKEQATEIVFRLKLVHVKSTLLRSAGTFYSIDFIRSEIARINEIKEEKEKELAVIKDVILEYELALLNDDALRWHGDNKSVDEVIVILKEYGTY